MNIEFKRLTQVKKSEIIELMNHPLVIKHMPLATGAFDEIECDKFIAAKEKLWDEYGFGPWAIMINEQFVGWGGLQPEQGEIEVALVLHPKRWGAGKAIYQKIIHYAFDILGLQSIIALFPPSRIRTKGILRLGFKQEGMHEIEDKQFLCYRLKASEKHDKTMAKEKIEFVFEHVGEENLDLVKEWLHQDFIAEWFHGTGLANTLKGLDKFTSGEKSFCTYWLAYDRDIPFAFLITSKIEKSPNDEYAAYCLEEGDAITLDLLIGDKNYLGKGLGKKLIQKFLLTEFPTISEVLIDPEATNTRAIHVYEKAGFKRVGEFIAKWHPVLHYMMRLSMRDIRKI